MSSTRRDFEAVATAIRSVETMPDTRAARRGMALLLAEYFQRQNPRFDWDRFMRACGFDLADTQP
jgi:hypothetical protein